MENPLTCDLEDPFAVFSLVSLCPSTSKQRDLEPGPNLRHNDSLEAVGALLESMVPKNPHKLLEEALNVEDDVRGEDTLGDLHGVNCENLQGRKSPGLPGRKKVVFSFKPSSSQSECLVPDLDISKYSDPVESFRAFEANENEKMEIRRQQEQGAPLHSPYVKRIRGPGLPGRKKAIFSFKPSSSQSECLVSDLNFSKYSDPVESFRAFEANERAKKEIRRQQDAPLDSPYVKRIRGPGLFGLSRKPAIYKHLFPLPPSDDKTFLSSQETLSQELCSPIPSNHLVQTENTDTILLSLTRELSVSAGKESASDMLQSGQDIDDDTDDMIRRLQERFKPIEIPESCLDDVSRALQSELKTLAEYLRTQDKVSDLDDVVSAIGKETTLGCNNVERSSVHSSTSLKPPKSPLSSISSLNKCLFQNRKEKGQFSAVDIYSSLPGKAAFYKDTHDWAVHLERKRDLVSKFTQVLAALDVENSAKYSVKMLNTSSTNGIHIESGDAAGDNDMRETNPSSPVHESECGLFGKDTQALAAVKFTSSEKRIKGDSVLLGVPSDFTEHMELDVDIVKYDERDVNPQSPLCGKESDTTYTMETFKERSAALGVYSDGAVDNSMISSFGLNTAPHVEMDHEIRASDMQGRVLEDNQSKVFDDAVDPADEHIQPDERVVAEEIQDFNMENSNHNAEISTANALENLGKDRSSSERDVPTMGAIGDHDHNRPSTSQTQPLKKTRKALSKMAPAETRVVVASKRSREWKECSKRKSLSACGTRWESGVRRSTRIRTRPLDYWKGERQLYGRIHDSMMTVIGIKYFSPTKEGAEAVLKVHSYVPDEYMEIVEQAALH